MQFAEVLSRDEAHALARFTEDYGVEYLLKTGSAVISLSRTLQSAGYTRVAGPLQPEVVQKLFSTETRMGDGFVYAVPKLAVSAPFHEEVYYRGGQTSARFRSQPFGWGSGAWSLEVLWRENRRTPEDIRISSKLPPLPLEARQALTDHPKGLVLWEAEWTVSYQPLPALGDPAIIVPVYGDLYAVAYTWDLTPVEREALAKAMA